MAELSIADNGSGIPTGVDFANSTGYGLLLLEELAKQIGGTVEIDRTGGTKIILAFPARSTK